VKLMRLWAKRNDLLLAFYGAWLTALTVLGFGWPWQW
jgi:hypothetical protein